ncbi:4-hydroxybenzoate octaprenyltransferase [Iodidimonas gelatinilytica]|uniref:4-hydroxybenzoate octaprenyltransferase n=3 Tax=Iodidimonas gelatinilytica TaxID=1236966 RepID=A0A5A7MTL3_9PROT|nr:4-hydroxybenzoate octaprenyltransferase [Iodidimonas gelatinilytica]GEQ98954.1 4-hydroxybenzoate octaprenyltransferase [Iodidimonas gelatinilytica]
MNGWIDDTNRPPSPSGLTGADGKGFVATMTDTIKTPDSVVSWVGRMPRATRPYLRLMRADRPAGFWLLMWPAWWSTAFALPPSTPDFWRFCALFFIGSIVMRGAGCTWNDIVDRKLDKAVARTALRPIPAGEVSVQKAILFAIVLSLSGFAVLVQLNSFAILLGVLSLIPVTIYPFAKRITNWPQAVLGLTFNWGALMGWAAAFGTLGPVPLLLYAGCLFWTLGYDTIYAHQDKADDAIVGVKSTALKLGNQSARWIAGFYLIFLIATGFAGSLAGFGWGWWPGLVALAGHLAGK